MSPIPKRTQSPGWTTSFSRLRKGGACCTFTIAGDFDAPLENFGPSER